MRFAESVGFLMAIMFASNVLGQITTAVYDPILLAQTNPKTVVASSIDDNQPKWTAPDGTMITGHVDVNGNVTDAENVDKRGVKRHIIVQPPPANSVRYFVNDDPILLISTQFNTDNKTNNLVVQIESRARTMEVTYSAIPTTKGDVQGVIKFPRGGPAAWHFTLNRWSDVKSNLDSSFRTYFPTYSTLVRQFNPALTRPNVKLTTVVAPDSGSAATTYELKTPGKTTGNAFKVIFIGICAASAITGPVVAVPTCMLAGIAALIIDDDASASSGGGSGGSGVSPASSQGPGGDTGGGGDAATKSIEKDKSSTKPPDK